MRLGLGPTTWAKIKYRINFIGLYDMLLTYLAVVNSLLQMASQRLVDLCLILPGDITNRMSWYFFGWKSDVKTVLWRLVLKQCLEMIERG